MRFTSLRQVCQKMLRVQPPPPSSDSNGQSRCVRQVRQTTWLEVRRLWSAGLAGYWSLAVFLIVGHAACHITGPSVILSVILAAISAALSGIFIYIVLKIYSY